MGRAPCCSKVGLHRGPWTSREDALLIKYIEDHGEGQWRSLPKRAGLLRCGKSCRLRWMNYLRPNIKRGDITPDEDDLIIKMHALLGNRWSLIAGRLPGRTDNEIKNHWNTRLSRKLKSQGIDPNTHKKISGPFVQTSKESRKNKRNAAATSNSKQKKSKKKLNVQEAEKTKIHNPKPTRLTSSSPLFGTINWSTDPTMASEALRYGSGDRALDSEEVVGTHWSDYNFDCNDHDLGLSLDCQSYVPPLNNCNLEKVYEEYLQLLKAEENEEENVDFFAESLII